MVTGFYFVIMILWFIGAEVWIFAAARSDNPRYFVVAGFYALVALIYGVLAIASQAHP